MLFHTGFSSLWGSFIGLFKITMKILEISGDRCNLLLFLGELFMKSRRDNNSLCMGACTVKELQNNLFHTVSSHLTIMFQWGRVKDD